MTHGKTGCMAVALLVLSYPALAQDQYAMNTRYVPEAGYISRHEPEADYERRRPAPYTHHVAPAQGTGAYAPRPVYQQAAGRYEPYRHYDPAPAHQPEYTHSGAAMHGQDDLPAAGMDEAADVEEAPRTWEFSGGATLTSDYVFRGYSQTDEHPAMQGYISVAHESGLSATLWGSNVDFDDGDQATAEIDAILAYDFDLGPGSMSLGGGYYMYSGADSNLDYDYGELFATYSHGLFADGLELAWSGYYSPQFFGDSGTAQYLQVEPAFSLFNGLIDARAAAGYQWIEDNAVAGIPDYWNWSAGLSHTWDESVTLGVKYHDTNVDRVDCGDLCVARLVLSLDYSM